MATESGFQPAGAGAVSPREEDQELWKEKERDTMKEEFRGVFGGSAEEAVERERRGDVREEAARARARKVERVPSDEEVEDHSLDHAVLRTWCPPALRERQSRMGT